MPPLLHSICVHFFISCAPEDLLARPSISPVRRALFQSAAVEGGIETPEPLNISPVHPILPHIPQHTRHTKRIDPIQPPDLAVADALQIADANLHQRRVGHLPPVTVSVYPAHQCAANGFAPRHQLPHNMGMKLVGFGDLLQQPPILKHPSDGGAHLRPVDLLVQPRHRTTHRIAAAQECLSKLLEIAPVEIFEQIAFLLGLVRAVLTFGLVQPQPDQLVVHRRFAPAQRFCKAGDVIAVVLSA